MGIFDKPKAKETPIEKRLPRFVDVNDVFKYEGEYYQKQRDYISLFSTRPKEPEFDKLNRHRCSSSCDKDFYKNLDVSKIQPLTIDDYKKIANERWHLRSEIMSQMCTDAIHSALSSTYEIDNKCIGGVSFIKRVADDYNEPNEILVIHGGEVVAVELDFHNLGGFYGNPPSLAYTLSKAIDKYIGWDNFIDGIYAGDIVKDIDATSLNVKDALARWNIAQFKKDESKLENTLEELYAYQRDLNAILEKQDINTTKHISSYREMIMFINSIQLYKNILEPKFNVAMLKEDKYQSQLTDWIE